MVYVRISLVTLTLCLALLAGCIGGDGDDELDPGDDGGGNTNVKDGATVKGQVFDVNLNPIHRARVSLVLASVEVAGETTSDEQGNYAIRGVEAGTYRLTVSAACCEEAIETVTLGADAEVERSFLLEPYTQDDLKIPYDAYDEATAFIACQFTLPNDQSSGCGVVEGNAPRHGFSVRKGLRTIVAGLSWQASGGIAQASELEFRILSSGQETYKFTSGTSPLELRVDNSEIEEPLEKFEEYDEKGFTLQLAARPAAGSVVYQQPIDYYYHLFYWEEAPDGVSALPDG